MATNLEIDNQLIQEALKHSVNKARQLEQSLHKTFNCHRIRGEWFKADIEILNYIQKSALDN